MSGILGALIGSMKAAIQGDYQLLETQVIASTVTTVDFLNLDLYSDFNHLQLRASARSSVSSTSLENARLRINSSSANYAYHNIDSNGDSVLANSLATQAYIELFDCLPGLNATAGVYGNFIIDILDFKSTSKNKTVKALTGGSLAETAVTFTSGFLNSTSPMTTLSFFSAAGITAGSRFSLYGIK